MEFRASYGELLLAAIGTRVAFHCFVADDTSHMVKVTDCLLLFNTCEPVESHQFLYHRS
jgi:hypothetical protein